MTHVGEMIFLMMTHVGQIVFLMIMTRVGQKIFLVIMTHVGQKIFLMIMTQVYTSSLPICSMYIKIQVIEPQTSSVEHGIVPSVWLHNIGGHELLRWSNRTNVKPCIIMCLLNEQWFGPASEDPCRKEFPDDQNMDGATCLCSSGLNTEKNQEACC